MCIAICGIDIAELAICTSITKNILLCSTVTTIWVLLSFKALCAAMNSLHNL